MRESHGLVGGESSKVGVQLALVLNMVDYRFMHTTLFTFNQNETLLFQTKIAAY